LNSWHRVSESAERERGGGFSPKKTIEQGKKKNVLPSALSSGTTPH
jgi:hypothetical protein